MKKMVTHLTVFLACFFCLFNPAFSEGGLRYEIRQVIENLDADPVEVYLWDVGETYPFEKVDPAYVGVRDGVFDHYTRGRDGSLTMLHIPEDLDSSVDQLLGLARSDADFSLILEQFAVPASVSGYGVQDKVTDAFLKLNMRVPYVIARPSMEAVGIRAAMAEALRAAGDLRMLLSVITLMAPPVGDTSLPVAVYDPARQTVLMYGETISPVDILEQAGLAVFHAMTMTPGGRLTLERWLAKQGWERDRGMKKGDPYILLSNWRQPVWERVVSDYLKMDPSATAWIAPSPFSRRAAEWFGIQFAEAVMTGTDRFGVLHLVQEQYEGIVSALQARYRKG